MKLNQKLIRREQRNDNINWRAWYYTFGKFDKKSDPKFLLEEKKESNLKLLKEKILQVNNFLLLNFAIFSYGERVISKHLTLVVAYVSITNNLKLTTTFLIMKSIIRKFQILQHNNNFRSDILL